MKTQSLKPVRSAYYIPSGARKLRDLPEGVIPPIQTRYLNDVTAYFLKAFLKVYGNEELTDEDRAKIRRYLEKIFEARDAVNPPEPKGGFYTRKP